MLKHIVVYKLKDRADAGELASRFRAMKGKIDVLLGLEAGIDVTESERSFDVALVCDFKDRAALEEYIVHPVHLPVKEFVKKVAEQSRSVDFEY